MLLADSFGFFGPNGWMSAVTSGTMGCPRQLLKAGTNWSWNGLRLREPSATCRLSGNLEGHDCVKADCFGNVAKVWKKKSCSLIEAPLSKTAPAFSTPLSITRTPSSQARSETCSVTVLKDMSWISPHICIMKNLDQHIHLGTKFPKINQNKSHQIRSINPLWFITYPPLKKKRTPAFRYREPAFRATAPEKSSLVDA